MIKCKTQIKLFFFFTRILFISFPNPIIICVSLLSLIVISNFFLWNFFNSFFVSYLIIALFIGGLLILFVYTSAVLPNQINLINLNGLIIFIFIVSLVFSQEESLSDSKILWNISNVFIVNYEIIFFAVFLMLYILIILIDLLLNPRSPLKSIK